MKKKNKLTPKTNDIRFSCPNQFEKEETKDYSQRLINVLAHSDELQKRFHWQFYQIREKKHTQARRTHTKKVNREM